MLGIEVHADELGQLAHVVVGRAGLDPVVERLIEFAVGLEPLAAGVLHRADRLLQQRAVGGDGQVDAPADHLAGQAVMVALGIEAEERDPEAVLAARRAVATAGVAAGPHEHRHHVEPEAERGLNRGLGDLDRHRERLAAERDGSAWSCRPPAGRNVAPSRRRASGRPR